MDDWQLLDQLLQRQESDDLDFKSQQYNLKTNRNRSKFIKDILAMANTPRSGSAYIVLGVREHSGKVTGIPGVTDHPDESELGRIVSGKVNTTPRFTYRQVQYRELELGLIEIPPDQPSIVVPRADDEVLREKTVYIRRNAQNIAADPEDLARLFRSTQNEPSPGD